MPRETNTDRINVLFDKVNNLGTSLEERTNTFRESDASQKADIKAAEEKIDLLQQEVARLQQRCAALEKHTDRSWQVWLALLGAGIAILVAILRK